MRLFPLQLSAVPWALAERGQAEKNHGQTLERLAERGGLGASELLVALEGLPLSAITHNASPADLAARLAALLRELHGFGGALPR